LVGYVIRVFNRMTHNGQGFVAGVALVFRPPTAAAD